MSRDNLFAKANQREKKRREEEASRGNYSQANYEEVQYTALVAGEFTQVRILGDPISDDRGDKFSPKEINMARIVDAAGKQFRCIFEDDPSWIMNKILKKVLSGKWDEAKQVKIFDHTDKPSFKIVAKNSRENPYEQGWKPKKLILMNVLDRSKMPWHIENKHTMLLSSKVSTKETEGGTQYFYNNGVPKLLYTTVWDNIVEFNGDWGDYDVVLTKVTAAPWYKAYHITDDAKKFSGKLETNDETAERALTQEELSWERYDLDKLFKVTSYQKIFKRIGDFIKQVDLDFGTLFYSELQDLAQTEKKAYEDNKQEEEKSAPAKPASELPVADDYAEEPFSSTKAEEKAPEKVGEEGKEKADVAPRKRTRSTAPAGPDLDKLVQMGYEGVKKFTVEDKSYIKEVDDTGIVWIEEVAGNLWECVETTCGYPSPDNLSCCPKCGSLFD